MDNLLYFANVSEWREWLSQNHNKVKFIWMTFYKKHTKKECITYKDALQEALCWGWIDSLIKRVDEDEYVRKFTPRTNCKNWSEVNKQHIRKLIALNRLTEFGLAKIDLKILDEPVKSKEKLLIPDYLLQELKKHPAAKSFFDKLASSHQRNYIGWIDSAKKQETKNRRLSQAIEMMRNGEKLGIK